MKDFDYVTKLVDDMGLVPEQTIEELLAYLGAPDYIEQECPGCKEVRDYQVRLAVFAAAARIYAACVGTPSDWETVGAVQIAWEMWNEVKRPENGAPSDDGKIHGKFRVKAPS